MGQDPLPVPAVFLRPEGVQAHAVPVLDTVELHFRHLQVLFHPLVPPGPGQNLLRDEPVPPETGGDDVGNPRLPHRLKVPLRHHPPIAAQDRPRYPEDLSEVRQRLPERRRIRGVPREKEVRHRQPTPGQHHPEGKLAAVPPLVPRVAELGQPIRVRPLEVGRGRVEVEKVRVREQGPVEVVELDLLEPCPLHVPRPGVG